MKRYEMVHIPKFKAWFGDWERMETRQWLEGSPVATLTGQEFQKQADQSLIERGADWFANQGGEATHPEIGRVILDRSGVKSSLSKGIGAAKAAAFEAVPDVIRKGRIIDRQSNWKGRGYNTFVLAAPIKIGAEDRVMAVVIEQRADSRFYLHEAYLKENLQKGLSFKTGASQTSGAPSGDIGNLLRDIFTVNPDTVSKVVDVNGEPLLVWHSRLQPFDAFEKYGKFMGVSGVSGIHLTDNKEMARGYLDRYVELLQEFPFLFPPLPSRRRPGVGGSFIAASQSRKGIPRSLGSL